MSIVRRREYSDNFLLMDRRAIEDKNLSWRSRGLLAYLLSKPDHWKVSVAHLQKEGDCGRDAIYTMLKELEEHGYCSREQLRTKQGKASGYEYVITDIPFPEKPDTVQPDTAKPTQVSTDIKQVLSDSNWGDTPEGVDPTAWQEWSEYKRGRPAKATITKTANFLRQYPPQIQQQIADTAIRSGWKGMHPPKGQQISREQRQVNNTTNAMQEFACE